MRLAFVVLVLLAACAAGPATAQPAAPRTPVHECDRLVAPPTMLAGVPGVPFPRIDLAAGRTACEAAVREHPEEPRFVGLLARVELAANRDQEAARLAQDAAARGDAQALRLYRLAAEQGDADAQNNLGVMVENGMGGLTPDRNEAIRLYRLSAAQGNRYARDNLRQLGERP